MRAKWDLVDLDRGVLTAPLSKSGRPRHIPLPSAAVRVLQLQATPRVPGNPYVFPSWHKEGRLLEGLRRIWARAKETAALPADLRIHDLRHSLASALANAGTPL